MLEASCFNGPAGRSSPVLFREGGMAILMAQDGKITASLIVHKNGRKLYDGTEAQNILSHLGRLEWELVETYALSAPPPHGTSLPVTSTERTDTFYPCRTPVPSSTVYQWTKQLRSVYLLADGTHSVEQISRLLSYSKVLVEESLQRLRSLGAIK
jgi:hypothetical protein